jgi:hypothetical protein
VFAEFVADEAVADEVLVVRYRLAGWRTGLMLAR